MWPRVKPKTVLCATTFSPDVVCPITAAGLTIAFAD